MAQRIVRRGIQGWREANYLSLLFLEKQHPAHLWIRTNPDRTTFDLTIKGKGAFSGHSLQIRCYYPTPAQPPRFELLNKEEVARLNHAHIKPVYICLKSPWAPNIPLNVPVRAILNAWWKPLR